jgi:hypothetical protein
MESGAGVIGRIAREIHIFIKKGVMVHYVLIFTVLGGLPVLFRLAAVSAHLTWIGASYFTWKALHGDRAAAAEPLRPAA